MREGFLPTILHCGFRISPSERLSHYDFSSKLQQVVGKGCGHNLPSCATKVLELGICSAITPHGNAVCAHDAEKSLCDVVRGPLGHADLQIVIPAMRMYIGSDRCDPPKLIAYSRHLGVERKISGYLEALL